MVARLSFEGHKLPIRKLFLAIKRGGYKKTHFRLFTIENGELCACALGVAALNTGLVSEMEARDMASKGQAAENPVYQALRESFEIPFGKDIDRIASVNDRFSTLSLEEVATKAAAEMGVEL